MRAFLTRGGSGVNTGEAIEGKSRGGVWKGNVLQKDANETVIQEIIPETEVLP